MNYDIVATLGPGSAMPVMWKNMLEAGVSGFRLNTSHLTLPQLNEWLEKLLPFCLAQEPAPYVVLDLQGSKWRIGDIGSIELKTNQEVEFVYGRTADRPDVIPVPHKDFFTAIPLSSDELVLNDAKVRVKVGRYGRDWLKGQVIQDGKLSRNKGITFSASDYRMEALSTKDQTIIEQTRLLVGVRFAISYIRDAQETGKYRELFGENAYLIAKLERPSALVEADKIADQVNEMWLCRGDLGAEVGLKALGETVYDFSKKVKEFSHPVLMAGQVLEHMVDHTTPTRSEVCYIYEALSQGYSGLVLSDEAAIGPNAVESCQVAALYRD